MMEKYIFNKKLRDLDPEIWSLARQEELGELRKVYHASQRDSSAQLGRLLLLALGFTLTLPSVTLLIFEPSNPGVFLALPGLLCLVAGGCLFLPRRSVH